MNYKMPEKPYIPAWAEDIKGKYEDSIANAFILTGNIADYFGDSRTLSQFLPSYFSKNIKNLTEVYFYDAEASGYRVLPPARDIHDGGQYDWNTFMTMLPGRPNQENRTLFVFQYPEYLIPHSSNAYDENVTSRILSLHRVINSAEFNQSNNIVIIVAESTKDINEKFIGANCRAVVYDIPLPDEKARTEYVNYRLAMQSQYYSYLEPAIRSWELSMEEFVNLTSGLTLMAIEDVLLTAFSIERKKKNGLLPPDTKSLTRQMVIERKAQVINEGHGDVIEIFDTADFSLDTYAGQESLKTYFNDVVIPSFHDPEIAAIAPKGIIMMGPPGTGKTYFARCVAGSAGISFLEFKISKILGKYVGESEKSMERALSVFRALAPVGVFIDELDQAFPARSEGVHESSVNSNLFGMLLSEMAKPENRGRILWLAATNYPNKVDEALKRTGRFDKKIPFFAPTDEERKQVLLYHIKKHDMDAEADGADLDEIVADTSGYTQAEIESIVVKAHELVTRGKGTIKTVDALRCSKDLMLSAQNNKIKEMEDVALRECNDAEFIPEAMRARQLELLRPSIAQRESEFEGIRGVTNR